MVNLINYVKCLISWIDNQKFCAQLVCVPQLSVLNRRLDYEPLKELLTCTNHEIMYITIADTFILKFKVSNHSVNFTSLIQDILDIMYV
jgi:hypothetical protein